MLQKTTVNLDAPPPAKGRGEYINCVPGPSSGLMTPLIWVSVDQAVGALFACYPWTARVVLPQVCWYKVVAAGLAGSHNRLAGGPSRVDHGVVCLQDETRSFSKLYHCESSTLLYRETGVYENVLWIVNFNQIAIFFCVEQIENIVMQLTRTTMHALRWRSPRVVLIIWVIIWSWAVKFRLGQELVLC